MSLPLFKRKLRKRRCILYFDKIAEKRPTFDREVICGFSELLIDGGFYFNFLRRVIPHMHTGSRILCYEILNQIGRGTFSEVYLARHIPTGYEVAVKVINLSALDSDNQIGIIREVFCLLQIDHPNIYTLYQFVILGDFLYLFLEYAENGSLLEKVSSQKVLTEPVAKEYFVQILSALGYLHKARYIVHRDLKPQNVLISSQGTAKIIDFGFCNSINSGICHSFLGSPGFTPPEILGSDGYSFSCDIFSLGVCLYVMVSGKYPFDLQNSDKDLLARQINSLTYPSNLSDDVISLMRSMLRSEPEERISIEDIVKCNWLKGTIDDPSRFEYLPLPIDLRPFSRITDFGLMRRRSLLVPNKEIISILKSKSIDTRNIESDLRRGDISDKTAAYYIVSRCAHINSSEPHKVAKTPDHLLNLRRIGCTKARTVPIQRKQLPKERSTSRRQVSAEERSAPDA